MSPCAQKKTGADVAAIVRMTPVCDVGREGVPELVCVVGRPLATWLVGVKMLLLVCIVRMDIVGKWCCVEDVQSRWDSDD